MSYQRLFSLAEETKNEFLSKATGNAIHWIPAPGLRLHRSGLAAAFYVSPPGTGVAAKACVAALPFEPVKTMDILKDKPSWSRHCRKMTVVDTLAVGDGGTIEFVHTQYYGLTMMARAQDLWTLRYTTVLDDGSFVVCEQSISDCDGAPSSPTVVEFVRGTKLASGYLIQPDEEGSTLYMVEHLDWEASSVLQTIRHLYESPELVAKHMIFAALQYVELPLADKKVSSERMGNLVDAKLLNFFSHKFSRAFNDAINGLREDGWSTIDSGSSNGVTMTIRPSTSCEAQYDVDAVICVKAALLLHNINPAEMTRALRMRCSAWMGFDYNMDNHSEPYSKTFCALFPLKNDHDIDHNSVVCGSTYNGDERLGVIQFKRMTKLRCPLSPQTHSSGDIFHLQTISGMEDSGFEDCSELIYAPLDQSLPNEPNLLSYGFRIIKLRPMTPRLDSNTQNARPTSGPLPSLLILAFQFPVESCCQEDSIVMARNYIRHVLSVVKCISMQMAWSPITTFIANFVQLMRLCFKLYIGYDLNVSRPVGSFLEQIQGHHYAILCFSFSIHPVCLYANNMALIMLEATPHDLPTVKADRILSLSNDDGKFLRPILRAVLQKAQGFITLSRGHGTTVKNNLLSYERAVVWRVKGFDDNVRGMAMALMNWRHYSE